MALIALGTSGLIAWSSRPADEGKIKPEKADKIMRQAYGENWFEILVASETTNRAQLKAMLATFKLAVGLHQAR